MDVLPRVIPDHGILKICCPGRVMFNVHRVMHSLLHLVTIQKLLSLLFTKVFLAACSRTTTTRITLESMVPPCYIISPLYTCDSPFNERVLVAAQNVRKDVRNLCQKISSGANRPTGEANRRHSAASRRIPSVILVAVSLFSRYLVFPSFLFLLVPSWGCLPIFKSQTTLTLCVNVIQHSRIRCFMHRSYIEHWNQA